MPAFRVVVPMKQLAESKTRLASALTAERRSDLTLAMLVHVVRTTRAVEGADVSVVGGDAAVQRVCELTGCAFTPDPGKGLSACLTDAFTSAAGAGVETTLFVPADLPLLTADDVTRMVGLASEGHAVVVPDRHNAGTNGLAVHPGVPLSPSMGPGSFQRHLIQLATARAPYETARSPGLGLDIDTPEDLDTLLAGYPDLWDLVGAVVAEVR